MKKIFLIAFLFICSYCFSQKTANQALYIVNSELIVSPIFTKSLVNDIKKVDILKSEKGKEKYGEIGKFGVIEIETKSKTEGYTLNDFKKWFGLSDKAKVLVNGYEWNDPKITIEPTSIGEIKVEPVYIESSETYTKVVKITIDSTPPTSGKKGGIIIR